MRAKDATAFRPKVGRQTEMRAEQPVDPGPFHSHPRFVDGREEDGDKRRAIDLSRCCSIVHS